tara:strand:- start:250 stop:732 length:483 start_codon:yes stop_codon:yes gene_type:complete
MAFKMKGNPYKMGSHSTKKTMAYMKSPLEQKKTNPELTKTTTNTKDTFKETETKRLKGEKYTGERSKGGLLVEEKMIKAKGAKGGLAGGDIKAPKMKSPLEQTSFTDKVKSGVSAIWDNLGGSHESGKKRNVTFSDKVMRSYNKNKKEYRDADRKKKMNK